MDFIFNNLWLILVILGLFSSLFQDLKKDEKKQKRPFPVEKTTEQRKEKQPLFDELKKNFEQTFSELKQMEKKPETIHQKEITAAEPQPIQSQSTYEKQDVDEMNPLVERLDRRSVKNTSHRRLTPTVSKQSVVKGIIWSEILGPPRAKKPYTSNRFQK